MDCHNFLSHECHNDKYSRYLNLELNSLKNYIFYTMGTYWKSNCFVFLPSNDHFRTRVETLDFGKVDFWQFNKSSETNSVIRIYLKQGFALCNCQNVFFWWLNNQCRFFVRTALISGPSRPFWVYYGFYYGNKSFASFSNLVIWKKKWSELLKWQTEKLTSSIVFDMLIWQC